MKKLPNRPNNIGYRCSLNTDSKPPFSCMNYSKSSITETLSHTLYISLNFLYITFEKNGDTIYE